MRELTRTRKQVVREVTQHTQRLQKVLEDANIKLASVLSDIRGVSGKLMVNALIEGVTDPAVLAAFAVPRVKATQAALRAARRGKVTTHHRFLLQLHRDQADRLDDAIAEIDQRIADVIGPFVQAEARLKTIPRSPRLGGRPRRPAERRAPPMTLPLFHRRRSSRRSTRTTPERRNTVS